jgi:hypothetical protein
MPSPVVVIDPQEVELNTTGTFTVESANDETCRCGPIGTTRTISYRVLVISCPADLDSRGFMVDWQDIDRYFADTFRHLDKFPSCELIAIQAVRDIVSLVGADRCSAVTVIVGTGAIPAGMTARWSRVGRRIATV